LGLKLRANYLYREIEKTQKHEINRIKERKKNKEEIQSKKKAIFLKLRYNLSWN